jgi:hypothetical protein
MDTDIKHYLLLASYDLAKLPLPRVYNHSNNTPTSHQEAHTLYDHGFGAMINCDNKSALFCPQTVTSFCARKRFSEQFRKNTALHSELTVSPFSARDMN